MEQELASIFSFVLKSADSPQPYYRDIPQNFTVPSIYFPVPEITTSGDTFNTYGAEYDWYIKFFHSTTQEAYSLALKALTAIKENRNLIPLLDENGAKIGGIRIKDPELRIADECAVQLTIRFASRRPYIQVSGPKAQNFSTDVNLKPDPRIPKRTRYDTKLLRSVSIEVSKEKTDSSYDYERCGTKPEKK